MAININSKNVAKAEEELELARKDKIAFGKLFLPDDFGRSETPFFHYQMTDIVSDKSKLQTAFILPRGHGKTVITKCDILHEFCFAKEPLFFGWVAASSKISVPNLDYIKTHLEYNERLLYYFGQLKGKKWTEDDIELRNGCKLISKSNLSGIRGGAKMHKRYDLIVLDDFEDENNTVTQESRSKIANLVTAVVFPALEPKIGRLRINGTPVHYDSFIQKILNGYHQAKAQGKPFSWTVLTYKAENPDGTVLWPSFFPKEELERKKKFYIDSGTPWKYYQEYMMEVQNEEDSIFNRKHIKYWEGNFELVDGEPYINIKGEDPKPCVVYAGVDPATDSMRRGTDYNVIMLVAITHDSNIYVIEYLRRRGIPVQGILGETNLGLVDYMFKYAHQYKTSLFTIEDTTMSKPIFQTLRNEMRRRNDYSVRFKEEKPGNRMSKRDRIQEILAQRFSIGQIHIKREHYELQREIVTFGARMAHDDTIDALAYACKYSTPPTGKVEKGKWIKRKLTPRNWITA